MCSANTPTPFNVSSLCRPKPVQPHGTGLFTEEERKEDASLVVGVLRIFSSSFNHEGTLSPAGLPQLSPS